MHISQAMRILQRPTLALTLALTLSPLGGAHAQAPKAYSLKTEESTQESVLKALDDSFPDRPEWVDMLTDILQGSQLGPGDGWFRRATAQTRFDWKHVSARLDRDRDEKISRREYLGTDSDFARLDRDHDMALTEADFDFTPHALTPTPGAQLFLRLDSDGNGEISTDEFTEFFKKADSGGRGFLSLNDLQESLHPPRRSSAPPARPPGANVTGPGGPSKETLVRALFKQELGSLQAGPALGESAPDFKLSTNDGKDVITLSKLEGQKPIVLVFGNITCGPFRSQTGNIEKLYGLYKDRATFVMVYVREAHPANGWSSDSNFRLGITLAQPRTYDERMAAAQACGKRIKLSFPMLVDTIDDAVGGRYSGMPSRLYLIDRQGKVAYKSGRGPFGFKPAELEHSLLLLLQEEEPSRSINQARVPAP